MRLSIIVPVLNEEAILPKALEALVLLQETAPHGVVEVLAVDSGSGDRSLEIMERWADSGRGRTVACHSQSCPNIGSAVLEGVRRASGDFVLILPADCTLLPESLQELRRQIQSGNALCGGFYKTYVPESVALLVYCWVQNNLRARLLRNLAWTHAIFFRRDLVPAKRWPASGFLGDIRLSDALKGSKGWQLVRPPVLVSSRRYLPGKRLRRMLDNLVILALYRSGMATPEHLQDRYRKAR